MEDNRDYKKKQKFYFNESGQLVVESNRGVWVDGEHFVKMYGDFVCNAKTMGMIIQAMKGMTVEVGVEEIIRHSKNEKVDDILNINQYTIENYCVLGVDKSRVEEYIEDLAEKQYSKAEITREKELTDYYKNINIELSEKIDKTNAYIKICEEVIKKHNSSPWYKRFKKIKY